MEGSLDPCVVHAHAFFSHIGFINNEKLIH